MNNEKTAELLKLIAENPTLPIVAFVDSDIVCDDCGRWLASFGYACVGEYVCYDEKYFDDRESFKERYYDNNDEELCERFQYFPWINDFGVESGSCTAEQVAANKENEKRLDAYLSEIADKVFVKAILVNIDLPDPDELRRRTMKDRKAPFFYAGFVGSFQITFIILKLCGAITWNWWLVMLPLLIGAVAPIVFLVILLTVAIIQSFFKKW